MRANNNHSCGPSKPEVAMQRLVWDALTRIGNAARRSWTRRCARTSASATCCGSSLGAAASTAGSATSGVLHPVPPVRRMLPFIAPNASCISENQLHSGYLI